MNEPIKLKLPSPNEAHPEAYSFAIRSLLKGMLEFYLHTYLRNEDLTVEWNDVWKFWRITVFRDDRPIEGLGSPELRQRRWDNIKTELPVAFGAEPSYTYRWRKDPPDSDGQLSFEFETTEGFRFDVSP